jgi:hypothetical protein
METQSNIVSSIEDYSIRKLAAERAINEAFPGPLVEAIEAGPIEVITSVGPAFIRPVVLSDHIIGKKLNSPFYRNMVERSINNEKSNSEDATEEEIIDMIFQFTHTARDTRKVLSKGKEYYHEMAMEEIGDKYQITDLKDLVNAIIQQYSNCFKTAVKHDIRESDEVSGDSVKKKP